MSQRLNGRDYPTLPDSFLYDLKQELGLALEAVVPSALPAAERAFPQEITKTVGCSGVSFRTEPGDPPKVIATWAFEKPDGTTHTMDAAVPEDMRALLAVATLSGDEMVTSIYEATLPEVLVEFNKAWGLP
jgi:hypothetical protein